MGRTLNQPPTYLVSAFERESQSEENRALHPTGRQLSLPFPPLYKSPPSSSLSVTSSTLLLQCHPALRLPVVVGITIRVL